MARRGLMGGAIDGELAEGTHIISTVPCGVISIVLVGDGTNAASIKLYNHAATATGTVQIALATLTSGCCAIYTPCRPDAFDVGCVAVVASAAGVATGYVSIEPV